MYLLIGGTHRTELISAAKVRVFFGVHKYSLTYFFVTDYHQNPRILRLSWVLSFILCTSYQEVHQGFPSTVFYWLCPPNGCLSLRYKARWCACCRAPTPAKLREGQCCLRRQGSPTNGAPCTKKDVLKDALFIPTLSAHGCIAKGTSGSDGGQEWEKQT